MMDISRYKIKKKIRNNKVVFFPKYKNWYGGFSYYIIDDIFTYVSFGTELGARNFIQKEIDAKIKKYDKFLNFIK